MLSFMMRWRAQAILALLALVLVLSPPNSESWGHSLRATLPALGFGCALATGNGIDYAARGAVLTAGIYGPKFGLGDAAINRRPTGEPRGFPSGHAAATAFGASAIIQDCAANAPVLRIAAVLAAGFTGASRVEAGEHFSWQVLAGWLLGIAVDRAFRRRTRAAIATWFARRKSP